MNRNQYQLLKSSLSFVLLLFLSSVLFAQQTNKSALFFTNSKGEKVYTYKDSKNAYIKVINAKRNIDPNAVDDFYVVVSSEMEPNGESVKLTETGKNTDIFTGQIKFKVSPMAFAKSGFLEVAKGDKLTAKYTLSKNEQGVEDNVFNNAYYKGPEWTFYNTGANHIVLFPKNIIITIDGKPAEPGIFIGAFYKKGEGKNAKYVNAAGTGKGTAPGGFKWTGKVNAIAIWGTQDNKNNGFAEGEEFHWKIWNPKDGKVYDAVATYIDSDERITNRGTYTKDGISGVKTLTVVTKK